MTDRHNRVELLAPAGGPDALIAAVNNGADAVYLGLSELNARRGAANFDLESLSASARFAHLRGARVYLTANVVVLEGELGSALEMVASAWEAGVDAVIVQDLGFLRALRVALPDVRIHSSTQIDAMNPDAVSALAEQGARRVTLARELPLAAIAACAATGIEVETFVHGALCYCYSGQCLMSSLIGRRSANRGLCAQPCRLPYELAGPEGVVDAPGRYLLSARDLAGIAHLPSLIEAGVSALKIEGRMKSPEYVAIVTGVYRSALDRAFADPESFTVAPVEWEMLEEAFSRGFTDGYLTGKRGAELMSYTRPNNRGVRIGRVAAADGTRVKLELERALDPGDTLEVWTRSGRFAQPAGTLAIGGTKVPVAPAGSVAELQFEEPAAVGDRVFRVANAALLQAARRTFTGAAASDLRSTPVSFALRVRIGLPLQLSATAASTKVEVEGPEVAAARTKPITAEEIVEHVGRLGGSGYRAEGWSIDLDAEAGLGFSQLHALRRRALEALDAELLRPWSGRKSTRPVVPGLPDPLSPPAAPELVATVWDLAGAEACLAAGADRVLLRVFGDPASVGALPGRVAPLLPRVIWPNEAERYDGWFEGEVAVGNLGSLHRSTRPVETDWPLNVVNPHSVAALHEMGARFVWASPELSGRQLAQLVRSTDVPVGFVVWGRTELMVSEQCVLQAAGPCARRCATCNRAARWWRLRDQKGYEFPVTTDPTGRSHIVNSVTLDLTRALGEVVSAGVSAVRLDFTDEPVERMREVTSAVRSMLSSAVLGGPASEQPLVEPSTSGHFYRGLA